MKGCIRLSQSFGGGEGASHLVQHSSSSRGTGMLLRQNGGFLTALGVMTALAMIFWLRHAMEPLPCSKQFRGLEA